MSKFFPEVKKRRRRLVEVITDGSAKTFVYQDLDEDLEDNLEKPRSHKLWLWLRKVLDVVKIKTSNSN